MTKIRDRLLRLAFASMLAGITSATAQAPPPIETVVYNFGGALGIAPYAGLATDSSGNLYGTTTRGGSAGMGVVFKIDTTGHETVLHSFTGGADGAEPWGAVILDAEGNIYGTAYEGGAANAGVVYELDTSGKEIGLYSFLGGIYGANPECALLRDSAGNLYGTTTAGGGPNAGVVFKLDVNGGYDVLYVFNGGNDGGEPLAGVIADASGNLYGTTYHGGTADAGVVFQLDPSGRETVLHSFTGGSDGGRPAAGLFRDPAGHLYGTNQIGGAGGSGVVFRLNAAGAETVLHNFPFTAYASSPSGVILDAAGNIYGTNGQQGFGDGYVFELNAAGRLTLQYNFDGLNGALPYGGVIRDSAGNLYGTTAWGGSNWGNGVVFKLDPTGAETVLCNFIDASEGITPYSGLTRDPAGNVYGTASLGGVGGGVVYQINQAGQYKVLHRFRGGTDGATPYAGVIRDAAGNLYGTTYNGGTRNMGTVYQVDASGHESVLHTFNGGNADGAHPWGGLVADSTGNLYGTTTEGGTANAGVVFKVDTSGNETVLYSFSGGADGGLLYGGVTLDSSGNLYGTASAGGQFEYGTLFRMDTAGEGFTVLYNFEYGEGPPETSVILDSAGNIYGTGAGGLVYKLDTSGNETTLYNFGTTDGLIFPSALTLDSAGNLYGTIELYENDGIVYKLDPAGNMTVLHLFTDQADGGQPFSGVIFDASGNLLGTASVGGTGGQGVVFKLAVEH